MQTSPTQDGWWGIFTRRPPNGPYGSRFVAWVWLQCGHCHCSRIGIEGLRNFIWRIFSTGILLEFQRMANANVSKSTESTLTFLDFCMELRYEYECRQLMSRYGCYKIGLDVRTKFHLKIQRFSQCPTQNSAKNSNTGAFPRPGSGINLGIGTKGAASCP